MPSLDDLLAQSMLFTAARGLGVTPIEVTGAFAVPPPEPKTEDLDEVTIRNNGVWQWKHEPSAPGTWRDVNCWSRGMGMNYRMPVPVLDAVSWNNVQVVREDKSKVDLPLHDSFVVGTWRILHGRIREGQSSLWGLDARTDPSMLVALAYQLGSDNKPAPLTRAECDELGEALIPPANLPPRKLEYFAGPDAADAWVSVGPTRYVLLVELVLCKEHDDFAPAGMVGMCRVHPHALFWSNEALESIEATVVLQRPTEAMTHGDASMHQAIRALVVSDCNNPTTPTPDSRPVPLADIIYDYYEVDPRQTFEGRLATSDDHPRQLVGEVCLADPRHTRRRAIEGDIIRNMGTHPWRDKNAEKEPRQGQFDNVHLAPHMRMKFDKTVETREGTKKVPVAINEIVMLFVCMHDCLHMHVRWGARADETSTRGWFGGRPHAKAGAPTVPENQVVFAKIPKNNVLEYRAVAESVKVGALQVLCHHGLGYAIDEWPGVLAETARQSVRLGAEGIATAQHEPFMLDLPYTWPGFYWRFRYGGKLDARPVERLSFDLEKCMR